MKSITVENLTLMPRPVKSIVSMTISTNETDLISMQIQVSVPNSMTDLVEIQDHVAKVAIEQLQALKKTNPPK